MIRNFNLLKQITQNHQVDMLTFNQAPHFATPEELQQSIEVLRPLCGRLEVFRIPTDSSKWLWYLMLLANLFSPTPYSAWRFSSRKMEKAILNRLESESYDVMEIGTIALARFARLAPDLPKILVHHNVESILLSRRSRAVNKWTSKVYIRYQSWKLRKFERKQGTVFEYNTVCSDEDCMCLKAICPEARVVVVPNGVDTDYFQPSSAPEKPGTVVHAGGTNWFPNRDGLLYFMKEIWPILKRKMPTMEFTGIGKQVDRELAEFSQRDHTFRLLGFVQDVRPHVAEAAVYVVPLRVGGGTRLKILDAMAMGKAIVSTSIGAEGIKCVHGQDIMLADTPQDFSDRVVELLNDDTKRREIGRNAREKAVSMYSWKLIAPELERTYERAINLRKNG
jgi:polysaccharide biosynthesis protein PslH